LQSAVAALGRREAADQLEEIARWAMRAGQRL
jgi:hypothetical protein